MLSIAKRINSLALKNEINMVPGILSSRNLGTCFRVCPPSMPSANQSLWPGPRNDQPQFVTLRYVTNPKLTLITNVKI